MPNSKNRPLQGRLSQNSISKPLKVVLKRYRTQRVFEGMSWGLLIGSVCAIPFLVAQIVGWTVGASSPLILAVSAISGLALGALIGLVLPVDPHESARRTDKHYRFKDRLLTAMKLMPRQESTLMERLQIDDAARHAEKVDPKSVLPYRVPKHFAWALGVTLLAAGICLISPLLNPNHDAAAAQRLPEIESAVVNLQENLVEKVDEMAEENPEDESLKELADKLRELVEKLNGAATDPKEALSALSEMEQAIRSTVSGMQLEAIDASMMDAAEALSAAEATRSASQAMKSGNYSKAAEELDKLGADLNNALSKQERKAVAEQMKKASENMDRRGQQSMKNSAQKMSEGMEQGDGQKCKDGSCEMAGECRKQALRKGICEGLQGKLSLLGLCKSECNGGQCNSEGNCNKNGGNNTDKSDKSSKNWGTGAAGNPTSGEETNLDGTRERKDVTGQMGAAGESEYEKMNSNEAQQEQTGRQFRDAFQEYRKMSEAVLETEPIPLGQRQMIRRYFESIRPTESDAE